MMVKKNNKSGRIKISGAKKREENFFKNIGPVSIARSCLYKKYHPPVNEKGKNVAILPSHREVFKHYKESGFRDLGAAIRKTGIYSEVSAKNSNVVKTTKSWQMLLDEQLPEHHLARRHAEILDKRDYRKEIDDDGKVTMVDDGPNAAAVNKGLELAYKLRGSFSKDEAPPVSTVMYNLFYKPEVREQMKTFEEGLKQTLIHEIGKKSKKDMEEADRVREAEAAIASASNEDGVIDTQIID